MANPPRPWNKPLFDISDLETFIISFFVPCITHGKIAEAEGNGDCVTQGAIYGAMRVCCGLSCIAAYQRREAIRKSRGIEGETAEDFLTVCCCECFALTQESNEIAKYPAVKNQPVAYNMAPPSH
ncbi:hypothetical protein HDU93_008843 [Gonapodya sp. JEL0774]|nr:hypothetical protein HDU93_008843 [Gonapodya sp. JEL0774]